MRCEEGRGCCGDVSGSCRAGNAGHVVASKRTSRPAIGFVQITPDYSRLHPGLSIGGL